MASQSTLEPHATLREVIQEVPGAVSLFEKLGIDYCCGGERELDQACRQAGVAAAVVRASLETLREHKSPQPRPIDWNSRSLSELAEHIVDRHHAYVRRELPRLLELAEKVCGVHGQEHPELAEISRLIKGVAAELQVHMRKEELILFPYVEELEKLRSAGAAKIPPPPFGTVRNPISMMLQEHDEAGQAFKEMRRLSGGFQPPQKACASYEALYGRLEEFEQDLHLHIHLENNILFPRAVQLEEGGQG